MAEQHDLDIANQIGASFRADLNLALRAISAKQWGPSQPPNLLPYMDWVDTTTSTAPAVKLYDGASWLVMGIIDATNHLWQPIIGGGNATIASAATTNLASIAASGISITGTTGITGFGTVPKGQIKRLTFAGSLTLNYNVTSMILPGGRNIQTRAGDTCLAESLGAGNWQVYAYMPAGALPNAGLLTEANAASTATTDLGALATQIINITGTTGITSFGASANTDSPIYFVRFSGALTLTHNGTSLILPGAANITTAAGDSCIVQYLGGGNWKVLNYNGSVTGGLAGITSINGGQLAGFRNLLINGGLNVWQRGTTFAITGTSPVYTADRWAVAQIAGTVALTASQQAAPATGVPYSLRVQRNAGNTNVNNIYATQGIESINVSPYQGRQVTLSFYAKAGANFSAAAGTLVCGALTGTGTDQGVASGLAGTWTGTAFSQQNNTLTTTRQRFTQTFTIPTNCTELQPYLAYVPVGTAGANDWFEFDSVQLESGPVATPLENRGYAAELDLCQRYYQYFGRAATPGVEVIISQRVGSVYISILFNFIVAMRVGPTMGHSSPGWSTTTPGNSNVIGNYVNQSGGYCTQAGSLTLGSAYNPTPKSYYFILTASGGFGGAAGEVGRLELGNTAFIDFSAEL